MTPGDRTNLIPGMSPFAGLPQGPAPGGGMGYMPPPQMMPPANPMPGATNSYSGGQYTANSDLNMGGLLQHPGVQSMQMGMRRPLAVAQPLPPELAQLFPWLFAPPQQTAYDGMSSGTMGGGGSSSEGGPGPGGYG